MSSEIIFNEIKDSRGVLVSFEGNKNIPFDIKRVYVIKNVPGGMARGGHAHKNLKQVIVCLKGSCDFDLVEAVGGRIIKTTHTLNSHTTGLLVENRTWREMKNFSEDCVLMVLASEHYSEDDYIRNYESFIENSGN